MNSSSLHVADDTEVYDDDDDEHSIQANDPLEGSDTRLEERGRPSAELASGGRHYSVSHEPTDYSLFSNPQGLGLMRQRLFEIEGEIQLSSSDFEAYFPFVDNVWRKNKSGESQREDNVGTDWYWCRLKKPANYKSAVPRPTPEGKRARRKRVKGELTCGMSLKVIYNLQPTRNYTIIRGGLADMRHTHDLDYMDQLKRNGAIMDVARREAVKGFLPASIYDKMCSERDQMVEAGGKFMKLSDVRNVQYQWRQEHPNVALKAHTGYLQMRSGPRPKPPELEKPVLASPTKVTVPNLPEVPASIIHFPEEARHFLFGYLPDQKTLPNRPTPHITLTWASSLDSRISLMPGVQTAISSPETKAMTHYLRSCHDAILIGVRTAIADDPSLNCRLAGAGGYGGTGVAQQPRPIIVDPHARLHIRPDMKILKMVSEGRARAPWIVVAPGAPLHPTAVQILKAHGGEYLMINDFPGHGLGLNWDGLFQILYKEGIKSVMVEGGGIVLSELLRQQFSSLIDSVIVTIAPTFLGRSGVQVSPETTVDERGQPIMTRLEQVRWHPMGEKDIVLCGKISPPRLTPHVGPTNGMLPGLEAFAQSVPPEAGVGSHASTT